MLNNKYEVLNTYEKILDKIEKKKKVQLVNLYVFKC